MKLLIRLGSTYTFVFFLTIQFKTFITDPGGVFKFSLNKEG